MTSRAHVSAEAADLASIEAAFHPSNLVIPQFGKRYCAGCERQRMASPRSWRQQDWRCEECQGAGK